MTLALGKARSSRPQNLGCRGAESSGWFDVSPKTLCTRHNAWVDILLWRSCQSPIAHSCSLLNHLNSSEEECLSLPQNLMQIHCSTHSVILNGMATQYTCSLNSIYRPHWLVHWSDHCSRMCIPVHFPWLPGYIDVVITILIILTMAGLFPDKCHISILWEMVSFQYLIMWIIKII